MGFGRLPVFFSVALILAVLLVVTEGACLGATIFRGLPLAACLGHNGFLVTTLAILFLPLGLLVDCLSRRSSG
jgi:preprotein translocase subunit SecG